MQGTKTSSDCSRCFLISDSPFHTLLQWLGSSLVCHRTRWRQKNAVAVCRRFLWVARGPKPAWSQLLFAEVQGEADQVDWWFVVWLLKTLSFTSVSVTLWQVASKEDSCLLITALNHDVIYAKSPLILSCLGMHITPSCKNMITYFKHASKKNEIAAVLKHENLKWDV